jgi:Ca-activated chloride channel homolog
MVAVLHLLATTLAGQQPGQPTFRAGADVVEVAITVTDSDGRFVGGLNVDDFVVREGGHVQRLVYFSREREPVSLGLLLDVSGSMTPDKLSAAKQALTGLVDSQLDARDEVFFMQFGYSAMVTQEWTADRAAVQRAIREVDHPTGDTALRDALALAVPIAEGGQRRKKALLVISDGHDSRSAFTLVELQGAIARSGVLVYAIGVDGASNGGAGERVDAEALRRITDGAGGRTLVARGTSQLSGLVAQIGRELGGQYHAAYERDGPVDGARHIISVEVKRRNLRVRARAGYVAE